MRFPMDDAEVTEILKYNISPYLQNAIWLAPPMSLSALKLQCRRMEKLRRMQDESTKERRSMKVAEIDTYPTMPMQAARIPSGQSMFAEVEPFQSVDWQNEQVEAFTTNQRNAVPHAREYLICWNCVDIGHSYADCAATERRIFCYGCGTKNVIKPQCQRCNHPVNLRPNVMHPGMPRSQIPNTGPNRTTHNPNVLQQPARR